LPAKADSQKQHWFCHAILKPLMDRATEGEISLLFLDASHFVMGCDFLGHVYGRARRFVETFSSRKRHNVLGALDFISKKAVMVANGSYITACEVCEVFRKIAEVYVGKAAWIQLASATPPHLAKTSAGVLKPKHFIGVALILLTTLSIFFCVVKCQSCFLGK
jgi:hypothetical protein